MGRSRSRSGPRLRGVEVEMVCGTVPVVYLEPACVFHECASWMLQTALGASGKADGLYEHIEDRTLSAELWRCLHVRGEDAFLVRLARPDLRKVRAVGATGKRSVLLAVVIALVLHDDSGMEALWKELQGCHLDEAFLHLLKRAKSSNSFATAEERLLMKHRDREERRRRKKALRNKEDEDEGVVAKGGHLEVDGVEVDIILGRVPVLCLSTTSVFHENVSWLLQTALDFSGKADACFVYDSDKSIMDACTGQLGLTPHEIGLVRLRRDDLAHIKAVGTSGKRSMMLAAMLAFAIDSKDGLAWMQKDVVATSPQLGKSFDKLVRTARRLAGRDDSGHHKSSRNGHLRDDCISPKKRPPSGSRSARVLEALIAPSIAKTKPLAAPVEDDDDDSDDDCWGAWGANGQSATAATAPNDGSDPDRRPRAPPKPRPTQAPSAASYGSQRAVAPMAEDFASASRKKKKKPGRAEDHESGARHFAPQEARVREPPAVVKASDLDKELEAYFNS